MRKRKLLALGIAVCIAVSGLTGCSNPSDRADDNAAAVNSETTAVKNSEPVDPYGPVSDKVVTIHIGREESTDVTYPEGEDSLNNYIVKYLQKQLNVEYVYDFSVDTATYTTKVNMAMASGGMPDVMVVNYAQMVQLQQAGAIEDMTDAYKTYASEKLKKCFASSNGISEQLATIDGKMIAIPNIDCGMSGVPVLLVRGDWMDELGLAAPKTLDDIINIVNTFKEKNPGGNVTTGLAVDSDIFQTNGGQYHLNALFSLYDSYPGFWLKNEEGKVEYGAVQENTKTALAEIRKLVEQGVIDPSFVVRDWDSCSELVTSGQSGIFFGSWWSGQWVVSMLEAADDSVRWDMYIAPLDDKGKLKTAAMSPTTAYIVVKKGVSEDVKEAVVKTVNYQYDLDQDQASTVRPNGMDTPFSWHYYPINTLHCDYDAKEKQIDAVMQCIDGKVKYDDLNGDGKTWYNGYTKVLKDGFRAAVTENVATANAWGWATGAWTVESNKDLIQKVYAATYATTPSMQSGWTALDTMQKEIFLQILTGEADISAFDEFVDNWYAQGGQNITDEVQAMADGK